MTRVLLTLLIGLVVSGEPVLAGQVIWEGYQTQKYSFFGSKRKEIQITLEGISVDGVFLSPDKLSEEEICAYGLTNFPKRGVGYIPQYGSWPDYVNRIEWFRCNELRSQFLLSHDFQRANIDSNTARLTNNGSVPTDSSATVKNFRGVPDYIVCLNYPSSNAAQREAKSRGLTCGVGETTQAASAPVPKAKPKATSAALTAAEKEAERLRQELAVLRAEKAKQQQTISNDNKLPTITIASADTKGKQGIIRGKARDNTGIAEVTVGGRPVPFDASGNFKFETFVPADGKEVVIQVTDLNGLSNSKTVKLDRSKSNTTTAITFESLNPLGRKVAKNRDALALIIGIEKYKNTVDAAYADKDALMFRDYATEKLGIPSNRIKTLINNEADISGMLLGVRKWLRRSSKPNESDVYVFYAGHGITTPDREAYLFPYDGVTEVLDRTALLQKDLFSEIEKANPRNVTIFLDACYTGKARTGEVLMADAELRPIAIRPIDDGLPDNFTLLTASSGSEFSGPLKEVKQGMFSYFLMKGMEGVADTNQDNKITAGELHSYVKANVLQQSSDSQTPQLQGDSNRVLVQFQ